MIWHTYAHVPTCSTDRANGYVCVCDCVIICVFNPNTGMFFGEGGIASQLPFRSNESNIHFNYRLHRWGRWKERERESRQTDNTHIIKLAVRGRVWGTYKQTFGTKLPTKTRMQLNYSHTSNYIYVLGCDVVTALKRTHTHPHRFVRHDARVPTAPKNMGPYARARASNKRF